MESYELEDLIQKHLDKGFTVDVEWDSYNHVYEITVLSDWGDTFDDILFESELHRYNLDYWAERMALDSMDYLTKGGS